MEEKRRREEEVDLRRKKAEAEKTVERREDRFLRHNELADRIANWSLEEQEPLAV